MKIYREPSVFYDIRARGYRSICYSIKLVEKPDIFINMRHRFKTSVKVLSSNLIYLKNEQLLFSAVDINRGAEQDDPKMNTRM